MKNLIVFAGFLSALWLLSACANRVMPTGGDKDVKAPVILNAFPQNYSVNFTSHKIEIEFDEYIQLLDLQKQLIISPPMHPAPEMELKKRNLSITLPDTLKPNTTYTINFGNAIADFTEGNPLANFVYVFSTGTFLDSMVVAGSLFDALTLKPLKDAIALLYTAETPDTMIGITPPMYYGRAGVDGSFTIRNVRQGDYRLIGLDDKNNNYTAETSTEPVGEAEKIIHVIDSSFAIIYLAKQPPNFQSVVSSFREPPGKLMTIFALPVSEINWKFISSEPAQVIPFTNPGKDTTILYGLPEIADSVALVWFDHDIVIDTVFYRNQRGVSNETKGNMKTLSGKTYPQATGILNPETNPFVQWAAPLKSFDFSKIQVMKDSIAFEVQASYQDSLKSVISFESSWNEGQYSLIILPEAVVDIYGRTNDSVNIVFSIPSEQTKGSIDFNFRSSNPEKLLLQLINDKDEIIRQRSVQGELKGRFEQLDPGVYRLRNITDSNNNGKWDTGDFRKHIQPERVVYNAEQITVRANWEVELEWVE